MGILIGVLTFYLLGLALGRVKVDATIPDELKEWADGQVADRNFHNLSHLIERAIMALKETTTGGGRR